MSNLFFDLHEELQIKIMRMNPHPAVEAFKDKLKYEEHYMCELYLENAVWMYRNKLWKRIMVNKKGSYGYDIWTPEYLMWSHSLDLRQIEEDDDDEITDMERYRRIITMAS
jgi:hypothetical protein